MDTTIKYAALVIFLIVVLAVVWTLRGGFPIGRGRNSGPILEGNAGLHVEIGGGIKPRAQSDFGDSRSQRLSKPPRSAA